jgi:hypothetical protein
MGFVANTQRNEDRMRSPGCYWTWAVAFGLLMSSIIGSPLWTLLLGFAVLLVTASLWIVDNRRREMAK